MDPLTQILDSLRIRTSVFSRAEFFKPWSVHTRGMATPIFHVVVEGECYVHSLDPTEDHAPVRLRKGEIVILSRGQPHIMTSDVNLTPVPIAAIGEYGGEVSRESSVNRVRYAPGPEHGATLVCGTFEVDHSGAETLLGMLPTTLHIRPEGDLVPWLDSTLRLILAESSGQRLGASSVLSRLADVLFIYVLRAHVETMPRETRGWLAATRDDSVGRALSLIHSRPSEHWTADRLAESVGLSRSGFFARFTTLVGEPPATYLTRWRMVTAADLLLRNSRLSLAQLAERVGYRSEDSFARAFKRQMGMTPGRYRREQVATVA